MKTLRMLFYLTKRFPLYVITYFVNEILLALQSYVGNVVFLKYMMQALLEGAASEMLLILAGTAAFLIAADVYASWFNNRYKPIAEECIQREFYYTFRNGVAKCELSVYDNPVFYDDMTYIDKNIVKDTLALLSHISKMTAALINILLIIHLFYEIGFWLLVLSISAVVLSFAFNVPMMQLQNKRKYAVTCIERKREYFRSCFFVRESFLERKMTTIDSLLHSRYEGSVKDQIACERQFGLKLFLLHSLRELLATNLLMNLVLIAYLLYEVLITRKLPGSDFIATYNAVIVLMSYMMQMVMLWGQMAASAYTVEKYQKFISTESQFPAGREVEEQEKTRMEGNDVEEIYSIEFRNVSFSYPGTEIIVLKDINFCIHAGEKIAIVGKNGAGKTTLIHLLMGLYRPTQGEILINGKVLNGEQYSFYRQKFAAFFQGMKPLETTAAENVALDTEIDLERMHEALRKTDCEKLFPEPENTMIGVQFDPAGRILSGGECQRLMLAHCFYSNRELLIMDEPSSALDPVAERDFNLQVSELAGNKLVIFVTHRLTTVNMADYIYVIDDGRLCDKGSHEELVRKDGVYREMWKIQADKYSGCK